MTTNVAPFYTQKVYKWTDWKVVQSAKKLIYQYEDDGTVYNIWGYDGVEAHITSIFKDIVPDSIATVYSQVQNDADKTDFVNNYLANVNKVTDRPIGLKEGGVEGNLNLVTANTTYQAKVGASQLALCQLLTITALDDMYWGYNNTVTTSTGSPLYKNQQLIFELDPRYSFKIWLVASGSNKNARITESL